MAGNKVASDKTENCPGVLIDILPRPQCAAWRFNLPYRNCYTRVFQFSSLSTLEVTYIPPGDKTLSLGLCTFDRRIGRIFIKGEFFSHLSSNRSIANFYELYILRIFSKKNLIFSLNFNIHIIDSSSEMKNLGFSPTTYT